MMPVDINGSFTRVNYLLRPNKQVERKLLVEALHQLGRIGYPIPRYRYVGLGSIYYADFVLFHKYLYVSDMVCVEKRPIEERMKFNNPYDFIDLFMGSVAEYLPQLDRSRQHLIWLDYDEPLNAETLSDVAAAATTLPAGSVFVVTVRAQLTGLERAATQEGLEIRRVALAAEFRDVLGRLVVEEVQPKHLSLARVPVLFAEALRSQVAEALVDRRDARLSFLQLFNFKYSDGATMLTLGGIIDSAAEIARVKESGMLAARYTNTTVSPTDISVPYLTTREKHWLDRNLAACREDLSKVPFEIEQEQAKAYLDYYREYPTYFETIV